MGLGLGPVQMGKGEGRFGSQGTLPCGAGVHAVTAGGVGRQYVLHRSSFLLPPFSTNPINCTTWQSLLDPGEVSEPLSVLTQD